MLKIIEGIEKCDDYYKCSHIHHFYFQGMNEDKFLKLYKEYIGEYIPVFARVPNSSSKIITEKPIVKIVEELKTTLNRLNKYTKDKRIRDSLEVMSDITLLLYDGYIVVKEVPFEDISKEYMDGGDIKATKRDSEGIDYATNTLGLFRSFMDHLQNPFFD